MKFDAYFLVALTRAVAWMGLLFGSTKLDFFIHPSAVMLSVIKRAQSPRLRHPPMMLIQGVVIAANNSSQLFDALNCKSSGTLKRHAYPWLLYPARPVGQELE